MVKHQAAEEHAEEAAVEGREQKRGLRRAQAQVQGHVGQLQTDQVGHPYSVLGQIGVNGPLDLHQAPLEVPGKAGKELQPPGRDATEVGGLFPFHRAGGDVIDQTQHFRCGHQGLQARGNRGRGRGGNSSHGVNVLQQG